VIGNCLDAGTALRSIRWDLYLLLGGLYSFSVALQKTGLADQAAANLLMLLQHSSAYVSLLVIYAITLVATELLSNAAAVALVYRSPLLWPQAWGSRRCCLPQPWCSPPARASSRRLVTKPT